MTINDYIRQKFGSFGYHVSEAELLEFSLSTGLNGEDDISTENFEAVSVQMAKMIPSLLARPSSYSVSENGHSVSKSWDKEGLKVYYTNLCKQYGLENQLPKPKITFL